MIIKIDFSDVYGLGGGLSRRGRSRGREFQVGGVIEVVVSVHDQEREKKGSK